MTDVSEAGVNQDSQQANRWWVWATVAVGVFMATLDGSIVNISLPTIAQDLNTSLPATQWVVLAYMLGIAVLLLPSGRFSDMIGRRKVYVGGMLIFVIGSLLCGTATNVNTLILMRVLQSIGAAGLMSCGPAITTEAFQTERGKALGLIGSVVSLGSMTGPTLGGWIVEAWGWPWIFWVNIPVGILSIVFSWKILAPYDSPHHEPKPFDFRGALFSGVGLFSLLFLLTYGLELHWLHPLNIVLFLVFLGSTYAFIRQENRAPDPLVEFDLFREKLLTNSCIASLLSFVGITMIYFLVPFYLQIILNYSPAFSGWILLTTSFALMIFSPFSGNLSDRIGSRNLAITGMVVSTIGLMMIAVFTATTPLYWIITGLFLVGMGNGLFHSPNNSQMLGSVPPKSWGLIGGIMAIMRTVGMAFSVALLGFVYKHMHAEFTVIPGFIQAFQTAFIVGTAITLINALWIGWYRPNNMSG